MGNATGSGPAWKSHSLQDKVFRTLRAPAVFPWASPRPAHGPGRQVTPVPAPATLWDGGPQLPTALPSHRAHRGRPTHRPKSRPSLSPVPSPGRSPVPTAVAAPGALWLGRWDRSWLPGPAIYREPLLLPGSARPTGTH